MELKQQAAHETWMTSRMQTLMTLEVTYLRKTNLKFLGILSIPSPRIRPKIINIQKNKKVNSIRFLVFYPSLLRNTVTISSSLWRRHPLRMMGDLVKKNKNVKNNRALLFELLASKNTK